MEKPKRGAVVKRNNSLTNILLFIAIVVVSFLAGHKEISAITQQVGTGIQVQLAVCPQDNLEAQAMYKTDISTLWVTLVTETGSVSYTAKMLQAYERWEIAIPNGHTTVYSVVQVDGWEINDIVLDGPSILGFSSSIHNHDGSQMDFSVIIDEIGTVPNSPQSQTVTVSRITGWHPMTYEVTITCHQ